MARVENAGKYLRPAIDDFALCLRAERKSPKTVRTYTEAAAWLAARVLVPAGVTTWAGCTRVHVREHMAWLGESYSPAYASNQHRALRRFFAFLTSEYGLPDLVSSMKPPSVPAKLVPVFADGELEALEAACTGSRFTDVRDRAIIALFHSSGARLSEVANLKVTDLDLPNCEAIVTGKASRMRIVRFDAATAVALSRYKRARGHHKHAALPALWLGQTGAMLPNGIYQAIVRRRDKAGVKINPHRFRHDFSHRYRLNGGSETDLMAQNGWSSMASGVRYGASAAEQRARSHYDRIMG